MTRARVRPRPGSAAVTCSSLVKTLLPSVNVQLEFNTVMSIPQNTTSYSLLQFPYVQYAAAYESSHIGFNVMLHSNTVGTERLQEKTRTTNEELGRCHHTRPLTDGLDLGRSRGAGESRRRMASTCGPMQPSGCGMN